MSADQKFFDMFMVVLAALVGISVIIYIISDRISDETQMAFIAATPEYQDSIRARIAPVGNIRMPGDAAAAAAEAAVTAIPEPASAACLALLFAGAALRRRR